MTRTAYIAGYVRSGTTLLDRILGNLDNCTSVGELNFIWERSLARNELCGYGYLGNAQSRAPLQQIPCHEIPAHI